MYERIRGINQDLDLDYPYNPDDSIAQTISGMYRQMSASSGGFQRPKVVCFGDMEGNGPSSGDDPTSSHICWEPFVINERPLRVINVASGPSDAIIPTQFEVAIYASDKVSGLPGDLLWTGEAEAPLTSVAGPDGGGLTYIPCDIVLPPGHYWTGFKLNSVHIVNSYGRTGGCSFLIDFQNTVSTTNPGVVQIRTDSPGASVTPFFSSYPDMSTAVADGDDVFHSLRRVWLEVE